MTGRANALVMSCKNGAARSPLDRRQNYSLMCSTLYCLGTRRLGFPFRFHMSALAIRSACIVRGPNGSFPALISHAPPELYRAQIIDDQSLARPAWAVPGEFPGHRRKLAAAQFFDFHIVRLQLAPPFFSCAAASSPDHPCACENESNTNCCSCRRYSTCCGRTKTRFIRHCIAIRSSWIRKCGEI